MLSAGVPELLSEGSVVADRYVIEARMGDGAVGSVYRARHVKFGRSFAVKVLHPSLLENPKVLKRFEREAELAGRLRHTNVASVVDVGVHDGMHFMTMELAAGEPLHALIADGPFSEARMLDIAKQLCSGLQHAHEVGLIHRDFKPENVIIESAEGGREIARIVDWGVAIVREDAGDVDAPDRLTTKGIVVGTPHYMAPEQARGIAVDHRVDIFALGLICFELLTGQLPFDGDGVDVARANLNLPTPPMSERNPHVHVDPVLEAVVHELLAKDPDERPASGNAARELFELYERDRASCAVLLGVEIPVEDRVTHTFDQVADPDEPSADPERQRATDEVALVHDGRRYGLIAALFAVALAIVLWLGLRGGDKQATAPLVVVMDAREEIAMLDERHQDGIHEPVIEADAPEADLLPRSPSKKPIAPVAVPAKPAVPAHLPSAAEVANLYGAVGRELKALDAAKGIDATIDLWPRYRWIRINEWIATPEKRAQITRELERLRTDIAAARL